MIPLSAIVFLNVEFSKPKYASLVKESCLVGNAGVAVVWLVREENAREGGTNIWGRGNELPDTFWDRRWIWVGRAYFGHLHFIAQMELVVGWRRIHFAVIFDKSAEGWSARASLHLRQAAS